MQASKRSTSKKQPGGTKSSSPPDPPCLSFSALVGFAGSRSLGRQWRVLVARAVRSVGRGGRGLAVGCATGADAFVVSSALSAGLAPRLRVFAAFGPDGEGAWRCSARSGVDVAAGRGASVAWWAGGRGALVPRLRARTLAMVIAVARSGEGRGLVCFFGPGESRGTLLSARSAAASGVPVVAFRCGGELPSLGRGEWSRVLGRGVWRDAWAWVPARKGGGK